MFVVVRYGIFIFVVRYGIFMFAYFRCGILRWRFWFGIGGLRIRFHRLWGRKRVGGRWRGVFGRVSCSRVTWRFCCWISGPCSIIYWHKWTPPSVPSSQYNHSPAYWPQSQQSPQNRTPSQVISFKWLPNPECHKITRHSTQRKVTGCRFLVESVQARKHCFCPGFKVRRWLAICSGRRLSFLVRLE